MNTQWEYNKCQEFLDVFLKANSEFNRDNFTIKPFDKNKDVFYLGYKNKIAKTQIESKAYFNIFYKDVDIDITEILYRHKNVNDKMLFNLVKRSIMNIDVLLNPLYKATVGE
jgi:hypothetical protein